mgnify:CR=1 FL=1
MQEAGQFSVCGHSHAKKFSLIIEFYNKHIDKNGDKML